MIPHCRPPVWPADPAPSRAASRFRRDSPDGCTVALIGLADDLGVRLNGGRPGACEGPTAFRAALTRYGAADAMAGKPHLVYDAGDIIPAEGGDPAALHRTHDRVSEAVTALLSHGLFPVAIGGGHDLTFPFVRAVIEHHRARGVRVADGVYADAHLDVRETAGSGMPFRALVEQCGVERLNVDGLNPLVNTREHANWFAAHGGRATDSGSAESVPHTLGSPFFASFDLDAIDAAHAPGVSAANPCGWAVPYAVAWVGRAARNPHLACFDIMELCPPHDPDGRTARVAAHLILTLLHALPPRGCR